MGIYSIKPLFQKSLTPLKRILVKWKVSPTAINLLALLISISGGLAIYYSQYYIILLIYVPFMAFIRTALNALDGLVARELKVKNQKFGEVLNEFTDRLSDISIFSAFIFMPQVNTYLASATLVIILTNSYLSILSKAAGGKRQYGGLVGKADRMIYLGIFSIIVLITSNFNILNYFLVFISLATIITLIQRFIATKGELYR